jgi:hypothetical protein
MISQDMLDAHNGIQIQLAEKPVRERPIHTKQFFIVKRRPAVPLNPSLKSSKSSRG